MPSLGFLNPWLYSLPVAAPGAFRDIAKGISSPTGCGRAKHGWAALEGYDLATGLGVPDFKELKAAALNAASLAFHV